MNVKLVRVTFLNESKNNAENVEASLMVRCCESWNKNRITVFKKRRRSITDAGNGTGGIS